MVSVRHRGCLEAYVCGGDGFDATRLRRHQESRSTKLHQIPIVETGDLKRLSLLIFRGRAGNCGTLFSSPIVMGCNPQ